MENREAQAKPWSVAPPLRADPNRPLLSIIIPCRDRHALLAALIAHLLSIVDELAVAGAMEIIVVDDASTPPLSVPNDPRLRLLRLDAPSGAPLARQAGFAASAGDLIHFHDSDDRTDAAWLAAMVACLCAHADVDLAISARREIKNGEVRRKYPHFVAHAAHLPALVRFRLSLENCIGPLTACLFRRRVLTGIDFARLPASQDWQVYTAAAPHIRRYAVLTDVAFDYIKHEGPRISASHRRRLIGSLRLCRRLWKKRRLYSFARLFYLDRFAGRRLGEQWPRGLQGILRRTRARRLVVTMGVQSMFLFLGFYAWLYARIERFLLFRADKGLR